MEKAKHFKLYELVDKKTFDDMGEDAWELMHPDIIYSLDGIREFFDRPVIVNNWYWGGAFQWRGYRSPLCTIGAKGSYHRKGKAVDFDVKDMSAEIVRRKIVENKDDILLEKIMRLEDEVNWVHMDIANLPKGKSRIYLFRG